MKEAQRLISAGHAEWADPRPKPAAPALPEGDAPVAEAASGVRFIPQRLYQSMVDRLCAKGFAERESVEALDQLDVFPEICPREANL